MNLLKSMFMTGYMMMVMAVSGYAGWMIYRNGMQAGWLGVMLTTAPAMMTLMWLMMFRNATQTSYHMPLLNLMALAGIAIVTWQWFDGKAAIDVLILSVAGWMGLMLYIYWYSNFGRAPSVKLANGALLPEFTVTDASGHALNSKTFIGRPTILIFYRGNWCPFCSAQIKELVARFHELDALGVRVALVSPQPYRKNAQLAEKFGVNFEFLTDKDNRAAHILQIEDLHGLPMGMQMMGYDSNTVLPTVIITDSDGRIVWVHETDNYRIRPEPDVYLDVLRQRKLVAV